MIVAAKHFAAISALIVLTGCYEDKTTYATASKVSDPVVNTRQDAFVLSSESSRPHTQSSSSLLAHIADMERMLTARQAEIESTKTEIARRMERDARLKVDGPELRNEFTSIEAYQRSIGAIRAVLRDGYNELLGTKVSSDKDALDGLGRTSKLEFHVARRMSLGETYEARLGITVPEAESATLQSKEAGPPAITTLVAISDRVRASVESAHLKIQKLSKEEQELPSGASALWMWSLEPTRVGKVDIVVSVQHRVQVDGADRWVTVRHFPQTVIVDVTWWHQTKAVLASVPPAAQGAAALVTALGAAATGYWALHSNWSRKRRKKIRAKKPPKAA